MNNSPLFRTKYLKYKAKYLGLRSATQTGGSPPSKMTCIPPIDTECKAPPVPLPLVPVFHKYDGVDTKGPPLYGGNLPVGSAGWVTEVTKRDVGTKKERYEYTVFSTDCGKSDCRVAYPANVYDAANLVRNNLIVN